MYDEWKPIYSALVTDIMDQLGYRDQAMTPDIRPSHPDAFIAGRRSLLTRTPIPAPTLIPTAKFLPPTIKLAPATFSSLPPMAKSAPAFGASFSPRRPKLAASTPCSPTAWSAMCAR